jgi:phage recombination protein Bet
MSNALAPHQPGALALNDDELIDVLTTSLYPGANRQSVKMVLGYCKAAGLDPMQKPVHIVPMWDGKAKQMRDVVMPGVGLYRTQASRTGTFAGQSEPEFGPMVTAKIGGVEITYPEFAKVTVKKTMPNGTVADFTAVEYWIENYAVKGGADKSVAPNAMWTKRPRGQIAKCAAAQALRLAFPEMGAQPTAEEMEGKALQEEAHTAPTAPEIPPELIQAADAAAAQGVTAYQQFWTATGKVNRSWLAGGHETRKAAAVKADAERTVEAEPVEAEAAEVQE